LQANLSTYKSILNSIVTDGEDYSICILDTDYRYIFFNSKHEKLVSDLWHTKIKLNESFLEFVNDSQVKSEIKNCFNRAAKGEEFSNLQCLSKNKEEGSFFENQFIPIKDEADNVLAFTFKSRLKILNLKSSDQKRDTDFSKKMKVGHQNFDLLNYALQSAMHGIVITDKDGVIVWANKAIEKISGFELSEIIGETPRIFKTYIHDKSFYEAMWNTILAGKVWKGEIVNRKKDNSFYFEELTITPVFDTNNKITHFISFKEDITEARQKGKELEKSEATLKLIVEKIPAILWMVDTQLMFVSSQGAALKNMNLQPNQVVGMTLYDFFKTSDDNYSPIKAHLQALKGNSVQFEMKWQGDTYEAQVEPLRDSDNIIIGCVGIAHDISERIKYEEALIESKKKAEASSQLKSEFLAQMSHEIRTPLNVIMSSTSLLEEDLEDAENENIAISFQLINSAGRRIIRTIDLLLNMSEINTGSYEYATEDFDLVDEVLSVIIDRYKAKASDKDLELMISKETNDTQLYADKYSVNEIFENLVDNSLKYTEKGSVRIIVDRDENNKLTVCVTDTGIGISEEYLPKLFEKFSQEDQGYTRRFEGNGLGLALVKEYCNLNRARIIVESEKGKGSCFKVIFD
jgi:PAS domain S-box-containing protein